MIVRIWRGVTLTSIADRYLEYLNKSVVPCYRETNGNQGVIILREIQGELAHYLLLSLWESSEVLVKFAGPEVEIGEQDPEGASLLLAFESINKHY